MFSYNAKVRYSEVDSKRRLTIPATINYLQDTCVLHSETVGAGLDYVESTGRVWMLGAWRVEFLEDISFNDDIKINTWPYGFKSFFGYRNLTIEKDDKLCVRADSSWMLYSIRESRLVRAGDEDTKFYPCEPAIDMEECQRKLTFVGTCGDNKTIIIPEDYIDTNGHVNNGKYIKMAMDCCKLSGKISVLEAEYKMAAKLGDKVQCISFYNENQFFVEMKNENSEIYANVKFTMKN